MQKCWCGHCAFSNRVWDGWAWFINSVKKLGELNDHVYIGIVLSIFTNTADGKVAFNLVNTGYSKDIPEWTCRLACDCLCSKFESNTAPFFLKLCMMFENSRMDLSDKDPAIMITNLEALRHKMDEIGLVGRMSDMKFVICVNDNLHGEYYLC